MTSWGAFLGLFYVLAHSGKPWIVGTAIAVSLFIALLLIHKHIKRRFGLGSYSAYLLIALAAGALAILLIAINTHLPD